VKKKIEWLLVFGFFFYGCATPDTTPATCAPSRRSPICVQFFPPSFELQILASSVAMYIFSGFEGAIMIKEKLAAGGPAAFSHVTKSWVNSPDSEDKGSVSDVVGAVSDVVGAVSDVVGAVSDVAGVVSGVAQP